MKRLNADALQAMAWDNPGAQIELDHEQGIAVLTVGRVTYYAALTELEACS